MSVFILGPSIEILDEPVSVPMPAGKTGIALGTPPWEPGGTINLVLTDINADPATCPVNVQVYYVPKGNEPPTREQRTPAWFQSQGAAVKSNAMAVPTERPAAQFAVNVAGVTPGLYFVQTILEYAS